MKGSLRHLGALVGQSDTLWSSSAGAGTEDISRYLRRKLLCVYFYGKYTVFERETAKEVVERNRLNPDYKKPNVTFFETIEQLNEVGLWTFWSCCK